MAHEVPILEEIGHHTMLVEKVGKFSGANAAPAHDLAVVGAELLLWEEREEFLDTLRLLSLRDGCQDRTKGMHLFGLILVWRGPTLAKKVKP